MLELTKRPVRATRASELNEAMEFDYPVEVLPGGIVVEGPRGLWAPDLNDGEVWTAGRRRWELLDGYSAQQGYNGPIMHSSEYIGGRMAEDILATPGIYVAVVSYVSVDNCPACGEPADYCQGHGEVDDPDGHAVLVQHDLDDHRDCLSIASCQGDDVDGWAVARLKS